MRPLNVNWLLKCKGQIIGTILYYKGIFPYQPIPKLVDV